VPLCPFRLFCFRSTLFVPVASERCVFLFVLYPPSGQQKGAAVAESLLSVRACVCVCVGWPDSAVASQVRVSGHDLLCALSASIEALRIILPHRGRGLRCFVCRAWLGGERPG